MPRPIECSISIPALAHNLNRVRQHLTHHGQQASVWAVVKANAYGHGLERAIEAFAEADGLAMLDLDEAIRCRELGWKKPILLLEGFFEEEDLHCLQTYDLQTAIHSFHQLSFLQKVSIEKPLTAWLKLNTGMNRLGFSPKDYARAYSLLEQLHMQGVIEKVGYMTHFANADGVLGIDAAMHIFDHVTENMPKHPICICNSAATWRYPHMAYDWVRTGIILYGSSPFATVSAEEMGLKPTMQLRARLIGIQELSVGDSVGYGSQFQATEPMRIGVVACGYADGYPRLAPLGTPVAVNGIRTQLVGRVSMDMLTIDLRPLTDVSVGDMVELWGNTVPIDDVAKSCQTIAYELMTAVTARVPMRSEYKTLV